MANIVAGELSIYPLPIGARLPTDQKEKRSFYEASSIYPLPIGARLPTLRKKERNG